MIKKLLIALLITLFTAPCFAGTMTVTSTLEKSEVWITEQNVIRIKLVCVQPDANDTSEFNLSTYLNDGQMATIRGGLFYMVETVPSATAAPDAAYTLAFDSDLGSGILDLSGLSTSAAEINSGDVDLGMFPTIWDLQIDFGDLGSASDSVTLYIYILR